MKEKMKDLIAFDFNPGGFIGYELSDEEFFPLLQEIDEVQSNFENAEPFNENLVGQIKHEYRLTKNRKPLEKIAIKMAEEYTKIYNYKSGGATENLVLNEYWVNFQRKHEFNPFHNHDGEFVFVIYVKVPYTIEEEQAATAYVEARINRAGYFSFLFITPLGEITAFELAADKKFERRMILFPAKLNHQVYPFYSSDEFRITVSGNLFLKK
jgi:hypothetical protein